MSNDFSQYVTTRQAAEMLNVDPSQASRLLKAGKLKGIKLGHDWLVFKPSIGRYRETKSTKGWRPGRRRLPELQEAT